MTRRFKIIVASLVAFLALDAALIAVVLTTHRAPEKVSAVSGTAAIGGPFALIDTSGQPVTDQTYRGKWLLIYFGYTFCPDACPTALNEMSVALEALGPAANKLQPLFITVDPARDTREVMADYLKSFDPRIIGLTGTQAQTDAVAKTYRVYVAPHETDGGDYTVDHSAYLYVVNPDGKFVDVIAGETPGDQMAAKLRTLMTQPGI